MNKLIAFFKKLQLRRALTIFLASVLLIFSTACNSATNAQGANPDNPAVQAGGMNNPYKNGGDSYTDLKMSTDPKVTNTDKSKGDRADLQLNSLQLIAAANSEDILYPGAEEPAGRAKKEAELPIKTSKDFQQPEPGGLNQRNADLGQRFENRVGKAQEAFKEATEFLKEKADEAGERPEAQSNPALHK